MRKIMNEMDVIVKNMMNNLTAVEGKNLNDGIPFGGKFVDADTLSIDGVDTKDYPDFCDAYLDFAEYTDGTQLTEEETMEFQDDHPELIGEMAWESLL